ncbi:MAG: PTS ascorbate transporter subunit IIC [Chloroflexi bacterium]|nr:PTS ascorbate transporter subunit IIC [Chloroflexota bacterium]
MDILNVLIQLLTIPAILIGLVALIGLVVQRKTITQVILGTSKTILGFLILNIGVSAFTGPLKSFDTLFRSAFNLTGLYLEDNAAVALMMQRIGTQVGLVMVLGFVVNLLVARLTPFKWIYLTGHKAWAMAGGIAFALVALGVSGVPLVIVGALIQGIYMAVQPHLLQPWMRQVTGSDEYGFAHTLGSVVGFGAFFGKLLGNKEQSIEEMSLPSGLEFFRDIAITLSLIMVALFAVPSIFAPEAAAKLAGTQHIVVWITLQALTATGGFLVLLQGVRMFLGELNLAFRGIAQKIVPGSKPGLDCPVVFPFAPTAVATGLVVGFIAWLLGMGLCSLLRLQYIPVPSLMPVTFGCTSAAVFGNALGGRRGTVVAAFVTGLVWPVFGALFYPLLPFPEYEVVGTGLLTWDIYIVVGLIRAVGALFGLGR